MLVGCAWGLRLNSVPPNSHSSALIASLNDGCDTSQRRAASVKLFCSHTARKYLIWLSVIDACGGRHGMRLPACERRLAVAHDRRTVAAYPAGAVIVGAALAPNRDRQSDSRDFRLKGWPAAQSLLEGPGSIEHL